MANLLGFIEFLSDFQIVLYAAGVLVTCVTFFFGIRGWGRRRFFNIFAKECLLIGKNAPAYRNYQMRFLHYTPHTFTLVRSMESKENIPFRTFARSIAEDPLVFVVGASGVGKSVFMQRLSFRFRRRFHRKGSKRNLEDYDVLFFKISHTSSLVNILDRIEKKTEGEEKRFSVYIDGLDELPALDMMSGKNLVSQLVTELRKRDLFAKCKRIVISLRPEILESGYSDLIVNLGYQSEYTPPIWSVDKFSAAQTEHMFRTECRVSGVKHGEMKKRLSRVLSLMKNRDCIFSLPFAVTWANDILDNFRDSDLLNAHWYEIIGTIVEYDFSKREYPVYLNANGCTQTEDALTCEQFTKACVSFVLDLAAYMGTHRCRKVSRSAILRAGGDEEFSQQILVSRRLLNYVEDSEAGGEPVYEFVHNMIYWYALTAALLRPSCPVVDRRRIYNSEKAAHTMLPSLYAEGFYNLFRTGLPYMSYESFLGALEHGFLACTDVDLSLFLLLLPDGTQARFGADFLLTRENIRDILDDGYLAISGGREALAVLDRFEPETIRSLDLKGCTASDFGRLARFSRLDMLEFPDSVSAERAKSIVEETGISVGCVSVFAESAAALPASVTEHIAAWSVRFPPRNVEMYHEVALLRERLPIRLGFFAPGEDIYSPYFPTTDPRWREIFELCREYFFSGRQAVWEFFHSLSGGVMLTRDDSVYFHTVPELAGFASDVIRYLWNVAGGYSAPEYALNFNRLAPTAESSSLMANILNKVFTLGDYPFCDAEALCFLGAAMRKEIAESADVLLKKNETFMDSLLRVMLPYVIKSYARKMASAVGLFDEDSLETLVGVMGEERAMKLKRAVKASREKIDAIRLQGETFTPEQIEENRKGLQERYGISLGAIQKAVALVCEACLTQNCRSPEFPVLLFGLAAELGNPYGMYELGKCYEQGYGVEKDIGLAVDWYRAAADGFEGARAALERLTFVL